MRPRGSARSQRPARPCRAPVSQRSSTGLGEARCATSGACRSLGARGVAHRSKPSPIAVSSGACGAVTSCRPSRICALRSLVRMLLPPPGNPVPGQSRPWEHAHRRGAHLGAGPGCPRRCCHRRRNRPGSDGTAPAAVGDLRGHSDVARPWRVRCPRPRLCRRTTPPRHRLGSPVLGWAAVSSPRRGTAGPAPLGVRLSPNVRVCGLSP